MGSHDVFMVFELDDSGEKNRLDITDESNLQSLLHPEQVIVIVKEEMRRIYIWKGAKSPVRKRFISSRVASQLQEDLIKESAFHRCKIVSIDQGDELNEFLDAFNLESMAVTEKLEDMRYVRNIEKTGSAVLGKVIDEPASTKKEVDYYSPALEELKKAGKPITHKPSEFKKSEVATISKGEIDTVMNKILEVDVPSKHQRQNLIIGNKLYGVVSKKVNVFGEEVEETDWEPVSSLPKGVFTLDNYLFRIYSDKEKGIVQAIETLKCNIPSKTSSMKKIPFKLEGDEKKLPIHERILKIDVPENCQRQNLIINHSLYGAAVKTVEIFGEEIEEIKWELVKSIPKEIITLENHTFRVYFSDTNEIIDAVEVLKKEGATKKSTPKKSPAKKAATKKPAKKIGAKKSPTKRPALKKIPSKK